MDRHAPSHHSEMGELCEVCQNQRALHVVRYCGTAVAKRIASPCIDVQIGQGLQLLQGAQTAGLESHVCMELLSCIQPQLL